MLLRQRSLSILKSLSRTDRQMMADANPDCVGMVFEMRNEWEGWKRLGAAVGKLEQSAAPSVGVCTWLVATQTSSGRALLGGWCHPPHERGRYDLKSP